MILQLSETSYETWQNHVGKMVMPLSEFNGRIVGLVFWGVSHRNNNDKGVIRETVPWTQGLAKNINKDSAVPFFTRTTMAANTENNEALIDPLPNTATPIRDS